MAFDVNKIAGGYGSGELGDVTDPPAIDNINCYGQIIDLTVNTITLGEVSSSQYCSFKTGATIMIHSSLGKADNLGLYIICKIINISDKTLTVDKNLFTVFPTDILTSNNLQAIVSADFSTLTLENTTISPLAFDLTKGYGGILFIRSTIIEFLGGHIDLTNKGIPISATNQQRPATPQETSENISDRGKYAGWENHITARRFLLNRGCGALFLISLITNCISSSRIGNIKNSGEHFSRENICGGSTILMASSSIWNFRPEIISKSSPINYGMHPEYGFARCYIASHTKLRNDEGLYAYDTTSNKKYISQDLNIHDFGNGSYGDCINPTRPLNNYARVTNISSNGKQITISDITSNGIAQFKVGSMVMFHVSNHTYEDIRYIGYFIVSRIEAMKNDTIYLNTAIPSDDIFEMYSTQLIAIPEFKNLTINQDYTYTPKWDGKIGGICAVAVSENCNLSNGQLNVMTKGGANAYGIEGSEYIGNAQMHNCLPLGEGHGSIFLLANKITMNEKTRIGATYSGANFGGCGYNRSYNLNWNQINCPGGGYRGKTLQGTGGWPGTADTYAGYGSNGQEWKNYGGKGYQGAHVFIVADIIDGFNQAAISTGGSACATLADGYCGGAGYGGGSADAEWGANGGGYLAGGGNAQNDDNFNEYNANIVYKMIPVYRTETYTVEDTVENTTYVSDTPRYVRPTSVNIPSFSAGMAVWGKGINNDEYASFARQDAANESKAKYEETDKWLKDHGR